MGTKPQRRERICGLECVTDRESAELKFRESYRMLKWAAIFLVIAIIAALLGFTGIAGAAADIAKFLFFLFIAIFVIIFLLAIFTGRKLF